MSDFRIFLHVLFYFQENKKVPFTYCMKMPLKRVLLLFTYEFQFGQLYILHEKTIEKASVP
jgi:hypothetical protein